MVKQSGNIRICIQILINHLLNFSIHRMFAKWNAEIFYTGCPIITDKLIYKYLQLVRIFMIKFSESYIFLQIRLEGPTIEKSEIGDISSWKLIILIRVWQIVPYAMFGFYINPLNISVYSFFQTNFSVRLVQIYVFLK